MRTITKKEDIYNDYTLNIFSDASTRKGPDHTTAASYGAVAVCKDVIVDRFYRIHSISTSNAEELRGIRGSLRLVWKYRKEFEVYNLFSDSLYSIESILTINKKRYNYETNTIYTSNSMKKPISNQSLVIECVQMLKDLIYKHNLCINIYFQKGHVNSESLLRKAERSFRNHNNIKQPVDINLIRYISLYNDMVDHESRSILHTTNVYNNHFFDPVSFFPLGKITL